jgi:hypothetical protein
LTSSNGEKILNIYEFQKVQIPEDENGIPFKILSANCGRNYSLLLTK